MLDTLKPHHLIETTNKVVNNTYLIFAFSDKQSSEWDCPAASFPCQRTGGFNPIWKGIEPKRRAKSERDFLRQNWSNLDIDQLGRVYKGKYGLPICWLVGCEKWGRRIKLLIPTTLAWETKRGSGDAISWSRKQRALSSYGCERSGKKVTNSGQRAGKYKTADTDTNLHSVDGSIVGREAQRQKIGPTTNLELLLWLVWRKCLVTELMPSMVYLGTTCPTFSIADPSMAQLYFELRVSVKRRKDDSEKEQRRAGSQKLNKSCLNAERPTKERFRMNSFTRAHWPEGSESAHFRG